MKVIDGTLESNPSAGDSGWLWADLGDSLALLGHLDHAQRAYLAFINKSETKSPERTLDVLRSIAAKLKETASRDAPEVRPQFSSRITAEGRNTRLTAMSAEST